MAHTDGIIGLPLRLLAREIYDRVVAIKGAANVALVTGEEKITPPQASYFICTVEAMPLTRDFQFLAVDEVQLAADPERGHVFTDRLLHARGTHETMFLGSSIIKGWIQKLIPRAKFIQRKRFSELTYKGAKKLSRLPSRTAIVTFSTNDVYAIAELVRRQRGGAAVVMGSLSPRTRNAQVELYQSGDVDYLVATDAIGMGLNMDIDHVAFASTYKFDGQINRSLTATEMAQIAGRAGRHMNNGSFGTTANVPPMDEDLIEQIENHQFEAVKQIRWRNRNLAFNTVRDLQRSLEVPSKHSGLISPREPDDYKTLMSLAKDPDIQKISHGSAAVRRLWQVCQVPDFRKTMHDVHVKLLKQIFMNLQGPSGKLPTDWIAGHLEKLKRTDGDIDTLATRIAHTRTWTYISHVPDWVNDYKYWQDVARGIEDNLSDALHERLTQRFVDKRTAVLVRKLKDRSQLEAEINEMGDVHVEGHFIGTLKGLRFTSDMSVSHTDARTLKNIGNKAVVKELNARAQALSQAEDDAFSLSETGEILWNEMPVGKLSKGDSVLRPKVNLLASEQLNGAPLEAVTKRLNTFVTDQINTRLAALVKLADLPLTGTTRGIAYQVSEALGAMPRFKLNDQIRTLDKKDFGRLKFGGLRVGYEHVFMPLLLKPDPTQLRILLWAIHEERGQIPPPPPAGRVSYEVTEKLPREYYLTAGYALIKNLAVRLDMLDRLAGLLRKASRGLLETEEKPAAALTETSEATAEETNAEGTKAETSAETVEAPAEASPETPVAEEKPTSTEAKAKEQDKKNLPRNLPFKPTHEMLSLVGTTKEQFTLILEHLGYEASGEGDDVTYKKVGFKKRKFKGPKGDGAKPQNKKGSKPGKGPKTPNKFSKAKDKGFDPNSPFAVLKGLKTK